MAIFGKKKDLTVDELIAALNALSDEDKKKVLAKTTGEQVEEATLYVQAFLWLDSQPVSVLPGPQM